MQFAQVRLVHIIMLFLKSLSEYDTNDSNFLNLLLCVAAFLNSHHLS